MQDDLFPNVEPVDPTPLLPATDDAAQYGVPTIPQPLQD